MAPPSPRSHSITMLLTTFLVCATLVAPSLGRFVASDQLAAPPSFHAIPKLFDAALAEVVVNHIESPEAAPSSASKFQAPVIPFIAVSRDGMAHPMADSRFLTGILDIVRSDIAKVEKELSGTNPTDIANLCADKSDGFHVDPAASPPCSSFITCHLGNMSGPTPCPKGHLFDHHSTVCGPRRHVRCHHSAAAPTASHHKKIHHINIADRHRKSWDAANLMVTPQPIPVSEFNATTCALEDQSGCNYCNLLTYASKPAWEAIGGITSYSDVCANLTALELSVPAPTEVVTNVYDLCVALKMGDYALVKFRQFAVRFKACTALAPVSTDSVYKCIEKEQKAVCLPATLKLLQTMRATLGNNRNSGYHTSACSCTWKNASARFSIAANQFKNYCSMHFFGG